MALGNKAIFRELRQKVALSESEFDIKITLATNFAFETLQREKEQKLQVAKTTRDNRFVALGITALVILMLWIIVRWQFSTKINHTKDFINYVNLIENTSKKQKTIVNQTSKSISIPKETEDIILAKLKKFESGKKFLKPDISLAQIATLFDTNTKYLSEVVNKYKGKNINLYINELRIKYIVDKLKEEPKYRNYKVSYLAEECGFSTHSNFSAVFKSVTGITPNVFIQFLTDDVQTNNTSNVLNAES